MNPLNMVKVVQHSAFSPNLVTLIVDVSKKQNSEAVIEVQLIDNEFCVHIGNYGLNPEREISVNLFLTKSYLTPYLKTYLHVANKRLKL